MNERQSLNQINHTESMVFIVDDDAPFLRRLARAMESRGFAVEIAESVAEGIARAELLDSLPIQARE